MRLNFKEGVGYLTFPALESYPFVRHAFSTRLGGVSKDEFFSMNLSFHRGDPDAENVLENYRRICGAAGFPYEGLTASAQDHHTFIRRVGRQDRGVGIFPPRDLESVDGLVTDEPECGAGYLLCRLCSPLLFRPGKEGDWLGSWRIGGGLPAGSDGKW